LEQAWQKTRPDPYFLGWTEGRAEGEAKLLQKQLIRRFGPLPAWTEARLRGAGPAQLEAWGERVLAAATLTAALAAE
jgi:hypothetical protein